MAENPRDFCVLTNPYLTSSQVRSLEYAIETANIDIPIVLVNQPKDTNRDPDLEAEAVNKGLTLATLKLFFRILRREKGWAFVLAEKKMAERLGSASGYSNRIHVDNVSCLSDAEFHYVDPVTDGNWSRIPSEHIDIVQQSCDCIIRYGFGLIKGDILDATEYGVLSFHPADIREYRGLGPPKVFLDNRDTIGMTLQRLNEDIDGGEIISYRDIDISDCTTLWQIYEKLSQVQVTLLAEGILNLRDPSFEPTIPDSIGRYHSTTSRRSLYFATKILYKNILGRVKDRVN